MMMRVAINGFGRIGRMAARILLQRKSIKLVALNDLTSADHLAYLFHYDTVHGRYEKPVHAKDQLLVVGDQEILVLAEKDPEKLPWDRLKIDYVIESTGRFTERKEANKHLTAGAKRVVISAPGKGDVPTYVMGVNHKKYRPESDVVICNASCTTNCLAPLCKVLEDHFEIEEGLMTTVHSLTASQLPVDGPSHRDWRAGRAAGYNIIPASTGAAQAVTACLPQLKGKLTGMSFRVPTLDVSVVDLTVRLKKATSYEAIMQAMQEASLHEMKGILGVTDEEVVSSDFIGDARSCIVDKKAGIALNSNFYKLVAWYDNEWGYANRLVDLLEHMWHAEETQNKR